MNYYKFSNWVKETSPASIPTLSGVKKMFYSKGRTWSDHSFLRMGVYKSGGWAFDFRDELKKYIVRYTDGHLEEMWAPDRTSLRNALGSSRIHYIVDVPVEKYY